MRIFITGASGQNFIEGHRGWVAGGIAAPGSRGSRRDSLPSPGSSHQPQYARAHRQWANRPGSLSSSPAHHRLNRL
jgi:hypothetical protein